jgi:hypothetical protein
VLLVFASWQPARAITVADLPTQLQACIGSNNCIVDTSVPVAAYGQLEAYLYTDLAGGDIPGYTLLPPSGEENIYTGDIPFTGDIWLTVQSSYTLAGIPTVSRCIATR